MADIDIEKLLTDEEEEKDVENEAAPAAQEPSAEKKEEPSEDKVAKENARLKKALKSLQAKVKEKEQPEPEPADPDDKLATREGWLDEIDKRSEAKAKALVAPIYEANFKRAKDRFVKSHPEYGTAEKKDELRSILESVKAGGKVEEGEIYEEMGKSWASLHWKELESQSSKVSDSRRRAQSVAVQAASASDGAASEEEYSDEEAQEAARFGMTPEKYKKAAKAWAEANKGSV